MHGVSKGGLRLTGARGVDGCGGGIDQTRGGGRGGAYRFALLRGVSVLNEAECSRRHSR